MEGQQIFLFQLIELHFFAIGIDFVDQLTDIKTMTKTNHIFKNGVKQLRMLQSVLKNLNQRLRTSLIEMGHQRTFGRSIILSEVIYNFSYKKTNNNFNRSRRKDSLFLCVMTVIQLCLKLMTKICLGQAFRQFSVILTSDLSSLNF